MEHFTTTIALIGIVILVASLLSGMLERSGVPLVAVFLALGAALGPWGLGFVDVGFDSPVLKVLAMLALALVLFSDAVTIETTELRERKRLIWLLLGPGTLVPAVIVTLAARVLLDVSWPAAAILGAALASTDPVLLRSVLRNRAFPATPRVALRIETGMNDVVLLPIVVLSMVALQSAASDDVVGSRYIAQHLFGLFILGPLLGALIGWGGIRVLGWVRSHTGVRRDYESMYALGLAFTGFAAAEVVGGSGFLAAFAAGLMVASQDVELCDCFLEYGEATAEMLLLLTFVALGATLVWTGFTVIDGPTLVFAAIALVVRTVVLYPMLIRAKVEKRDRRLIALFGPRGLSTLLLTLLPVFAGIAGAERLFMISCLVVLISVLLHGGGIALYLRSITTRAAVLSAAPEARVAYSTVEAVPDRITIDELRALQRDGEPYVLADARAERNYLNDDVQAAAAVRLDPEDPVRDATAQRLSQRATLVVYCA